ncbi:MAG: CoA-binding protein [Termitinemataceae bacterium]
MKNNGDRRVVVLGASDNPERYSYRAVRELLHNGFTVFPVNPRLTELFGRAVVHSLQDIQVPVDTVTVYLSPHHSSPLIQDIIQLHPGRVILNPGAENPKLEQALEQAGIPWIHACSLVLLSTNRF